MKKNLEFWNKVQTTDVAHTKKVNQRGGFTAINAQYQIKQATEQWGMYGKTWGVKDCKYDYVKDETGKPIEITLEAKFFYPDGEFDMSVDASYRVGNDSRKKCLTDLTTKSLSKLGFSADIFLGMYEDNKYVMQRQKETKKLEETDRLVRFINTAKNIKQLQTVEEHLGLETKDLWDAKYAELETKQMKKDNG